MPTPDGRKWLNSDEISGRICDTLEKEHPTLATSRANLIERFKDAFSGMYGIEFKILRLTEKLKDAIEAGQFGPLFTDENGNPVAAQQYDASKGHLTTQAYEIWRAFKDIYTMDVLNAVDEDGNLL
jgi:hypothetical protein